MNFDESNTESAESNSEKESRKNKYKTKPVSCFDSTGPVLFVTQQSSFEIIFNTLEWYKCLLHCFKI